jgi:hypothetical protein
MVGSQANADSSEARPPAPCHPAADRLVVVGVIRWITSGKHNTAWDIYHWVYTLFSVYFSNNSKFIFVEKPTRHGTKTEDIYSGPDPCSRKGSTGGRTKQKQSEAANHYSRCGERDAIGL